MTAIAPTKEKKRERLLKAAVDWVYDQSCSEALMELEDAAADLVGTVAPRNMVADTCPRCGWVVDYGCKCPQGPATPLVHQKP